MSGAPHLRHSGRAIEEERNSRPLTGASERARHGWAASTSGPRLLTIAEAAATLRLHRTTVERTIRRGELACVRLGRRVLIERQVIDCYIEERREGAWRTQGEQGERLNAKDIG